MDIAILKRVVLFSLLTGSMFNVSGLDYVYISTPDPRTQLEVLEARSDTVIVRGSSKVGDVGIHTPSFTMGIIFVSRVEYYPQSFLGKRGKSYYGIKLEIEDERKTDEFEKPVRVSVCYVDYADLDALLQGIEMVIRTESAAVSLPYCEVAYRTKGDLRITKACRPDNYATVQCFGRDTPVARLSPKHLLRFKEIIQKAKDELDAIPELKSPTRPQSP